MINIKDLIIKAKNGDKEAFDELALRIKHYLNSKAGTILYNKQDIEDAVQSTLYIAFKELYTLNSPYAFKSWITTILYNQCYEICKDDIKQKKVVQKLSKYSRVIETEFDIDEFDSLINTLNGKEKEILDRLYRKDLTYKEISEELNINVSTLKYYNTTRLAKLKELLKKRTVIIFILCFFIVGVVVSAVTIISHLKKAVSTEEVGVNNDGVLMAIENLDWYQKVDMEYQELGNGYRIKMDYLLMDEMCLYMIFDLESEKDINKYTDVSLPDLKIVNENGDVICDKSSMNIHQYAQVFGYKLIENDDMHMQFLIYMYTDRFPISKNLDISFSNVVLYKKDVFTNTVNNINCNVNLSIDLIEKFINREYTTYSSNSSMIKKAILSNTGFYVILEDENFINFNNNKGHLIDNFNNVYDCYGYTFNNCITPKYIIVSNFTNRSSKLTLNISNNTFKLVKPN